MLFKEETAASLEGYEVGQETEMGAVNVMTGVFTGRSPKDKFFVMDETTKENGGSLGFINKDTLSSEYDELVTAAYKLKDGKYSTSVITTELGYHVVLRTETKEISETKYMRDPIEFVAVGAVSMLIGILIEMLL